MANVGPEAGRSRTLTARAATSWALSRCLSARTVSGPSSHQWPPPVKVGFFAMRARSEHLRQLADKCAVKAAAAQDHWTRASFEAERKQLLILAQQAEKLERQQLVGRPMGMTKR
jgi:hypothetical protein